MSERYTGWIRFRCTKDLELALSEMAKRDRRDLPDYLRIVLEDYVRLHEHQPPKPSPNTWPSTNPQLMVCEETTVTRPFKKRT